MNLLLQIKQLPRENWSLFTVTVINRLGSMALLFLIIFLHNSNGFSLQMAGWVMGLYGAGAFFAGAVGGWLSDWFEPFLVMFFSFLLSAFILFLYPFIHTIAYIYILTFIWGLVAESYRPANQVVLSKFCAPEQRKPAYSLNRLGINIGMSIAPIIGGALANINFDYIFWGDGITSLMAAFYLLIKFNSNIQVVRSQRSASAMQTSIFDTFKIALLDYKMRFVIIAFIITMIVFFQQTSTLPVFIIQLLNHTPLFLGTLYSINTLIIIFFELPLNLSISHWPHHLTLTIGAILLGIGFGSFVFLKSSVGLILGITIWTLGEMILFPSMAAYIIEIAPTEKRGIYMGLYTTAINTALIIGPIFGTFILNYFGPSALWGMCFFISTIAGLLFFKIPKT